MRFAAFLALVLSALFDTVCFAGEKPIQRIAFGSCIHQEDPQPIWGPIVATKPDLFLFIGDNIYHDVHRSKEAKGWTIRDKYKLQADVPGYRKLNKLCPILGTWDDHDYGVNDAGAENPDKKDYQEAFLDFFGIAKDSPRRKQAGIYYSQMFGPPEQRVQVILLDTRYFRSPLNKKAKSIPNIGPYLPNNDPKTTMLGETQWKWFAEQLQVPAKLRVIASSIQVVPEDHGWEKWMNFPHERERLFKVIRDSKAAGVVFVSGDRHLAELSMMDSGIGYPLYDLTSSGLTMAFKKWRTQEPNRHRVATMNYGNNFGLITIDWDKKDPVVSLQIRDEEGDTILQQKIPLSVLQPGKLKIKSAVPAPPATLNGKLLNADLVTTWMGKEATLEMTVQSTGSSKKSEMVFLNSTVDRGPDNFTVVLNKKGLGETTPAVAQKRFVGKRIRVTGTLSTFREQAQIIVSDPKRIETVME